MGPDGAVGRGDRAHGVSLGARAARPRRSDSTSPTPTAIVARRAAHGIALLPVVLYTPDWAASQPGQRTASPPARRVRLRGLHARARDALRPGGTFWTRTPSCPGARCASGRSGTSPTSTSTGHGRGTDAWAREYAACCKAAKPAIKAVDPGATVVLAGARGLRLDGTSTRLYRSGVARQLRRRRGQHLHRPARLRDQAASRWCRRALRRGGEPRKPIWVTEATLPAGKGRVPPPQPRVAAPVVHDRQRHGQAAARALQRWARERRRSLRLRRDLLVHVGVGLQRRTTSSTTRALRYRGVEPAGLASYEAGARRLQGCASGRRR